MSHTLPLHELAGVIPVKSAAGVLPHYAQGEGAPAICARRTGARLTEAELADVERFCSYCVAAAEKLATERTAATEPASPLIAAALDNEDIGAGHDIGRPGDVARGCAPRHCGNPDVGAAFGVLDGLAHATLTDQHDITDPGDTDVPVRGYVVEPRGHGLVAAYWLERGLARRHDDGVHGTALEVLVDRFTAAGWAVEPLRPTSRCVFAHRPQPVAPEAANHWALAMRPHA
ncbi:hypothetical protein [Actinacidiphila sp. ITFR-21]|uniref:hypothetical protein n=1 Tax=Actinacidiphila sp. ITFR-21 TaxID=3075199 RepID=UPI00288C27A0|nr:hypothetical protein [Streptomyces sp. ITFR-21]WNI20373.1 hypothetical protein RLT57_32740 [Streptomyces sp. ITFR-21]